MINWALVALVVYRLAQFSMLSQMLRHLCKLRLKALDALAQDPLTQQLSTQRKAG